MANEHFKPSNMLQAQHRGVAKLEEAGDDFATGYTYLDKWGYAPDVNFIDTMPL